MYDHLLLLEYPRSAADIIAAQFCPVYLCTYKNELETGLHLFRYDLPFFRRLSGCFSASKTAKSYQ